MKTISIHESCLVLLLFLFFGLFSVRVDAQEIEEFKIKREAVFEFQENPQLKKVTDDEYLIEFETKGFCDVSIAIENSEGKIVRHLASGVLGSNAPKPFMKESKKQSISWDLKDDTGQYVKDKNDCIVRISLGLKPQYESNLLYDSKKRVASWGFSRAPIFCSTPKGMVVYQTGAFDHVRKFNHDGEYLETIYPFSADDVNKIKGLPTHKFPQSGTILPLKKGFYQTTLLHGASVPLNVKRGKVGFSATSLTVQDGKMLLVSNRIMQFGVDQKVLAQNYEGADVGYEYVATGANADRKTHTSSPCSVALSKDGKFAYLSGYYFRHLWCFDGMHGVVKVNLETGEKEVFKGSMNVKDKKSDIEGFNVATSVAVDAADRVYVSDYMNDRVQVFDSKGVFLKSIPVAKPAKVQIDPKNQEIFVLSWVIHNRSLMGSKDIKKIEPKLFHLGSFDAPSLKKEYLIKSLPPFTGSYYEWTNELLSKGPAYMAEIDFYASPYKVWVGQNALNKFDSGDIQIYTIEKDELKLFRDFGDDIKKSSPRATPALLNRQRLYVNPVNGFLYVGEADGGVAKSFKQLIEINPLTQESKVVNIPFDSEDMCFDIDGYAYIRTGSVVARFDSQTWKEIPWDYGQELNGISFESSSNGRKADLISGLKLKGHRAHSFWHLGGMHVAANGNLIVSTCHPISAKIESSMASKSKFKFDESAMQPQAYPGRYMWGTLTVYDKHGKLVQEDAFPGIGHMNGVAIDNDSEIYAMVSGHRLINGKKYDQELSDDLSDTLVKVKSGASKVISSSQVVPLPIVSSNLPKRPADISGTQSSGGDGWVEGAEWFYGGIGFAGKNAAWDGGGCCCWNARFALDYYSRSFVPELRHFSVGVLDKNGNLICRVGKYGNEDDGLPMNKKNSSPNARSIGGDEVALFHGAYLAVQSDKNLYIADEGNNRIISVKLGYHKEVKLEVK